MASAVIKTADVAKTEANIIADANMAAVIAITNPAVKTTAATAIAVAIATAITDKAIIDIAAIKAIVKTIVETIRAAATAIIDIDIINAENTIETAIIANDIAIKIAEAIIDMAILIIPVANIIVDIKIADMVNAAEKTIAAITLTADTTTDIIRLNTVINILADTINTVDNNDNTAAVTVEIDKIIADTIDIAIVTIETRILAANIKFVIANAAVEPAKLTVDAASASIDAAKAVLEAATANCADARLRLDCATYAIYLANSIFAFAKSILADLIEYHALFI
jgi:hypothetical protein